MFIGIATFCFTGFCAMMLFGIDGSAYVDPSVSSYLIQAIVGIIVAIAAVAGVYFRKIKKKMSKKLGIEENKNKEIESDDILKEKKDL